MTRFNQVRLNQVIVKNENRLRKDGNMSFENVITLRGDKAIRTVSNEVAVEERKEVI